MSTQKFDLSLLVVSDVFNADASKLPLRIEENRIETRNDSQESCHIGFTVKGKGLQDSHRYRKKFRYRGSRVEQLENRFLVSLRDGSMLSASDLAKLRCS